MTETELAKRDHHFGAVLRFTGGDGAQGRDVDACRKAIGRYTTERRPDLTHGVTIHDPVPLGRDRLHVVLTVEAAGYGAGLMALEAMSLDPDILGYGLDLSNFMPARVVDGRFAPFQGEPESALADAFKALREIAQGPLLEAATCVDSALTRHIAGDLLRGIDGLRVRAERQALEAGIEFEPRTLDEPRPGMR